MASWPLNATGAAHDARLPQTVEKVKVQEAMRLLNHREDCYRSPKPAMRSRAGRKALFAGAGSQHGVCQQSEGCIPWMRPQIAEKVEVQDAVRLLNHREGCCRSPHSFRTPPAGVKAARRSVHPVDATAEGS